VPRINILAAATSEDLKAEVIAECVAARSEMHLATRRLSLPETHTPIH
jgi:hypothetical protein